MNIILTNDDGPESPLLPFFIERLSAFGDVTVIVPHREQSWTGKAMSRFEALTSATVMIGGVKARTVDGKPADCVNLALYNICSRMPDLVVAGINMGANTGIGFILSSGTVGACLEANIAGVPAIAVSQLLKAEHYRDWTANHRADAAEIARLCCQAEPILDTVFKKFLERDDAFSRPVTMNVNLPDTATADWQVVPSVIGRTTYGACFEQSGDAYRHNLQSIQQDEREDTDGIVILAGHVSLTCIDIWTFGRDGRAME